MFFETVVAFGTLAAVPGQEEVDGAGNNDQGRDENDNRHRSFVIPQGPACAISSNVMGEIASTDFDGTDVADTTSGFELSVDKGIGGVVEVVGTWTLSGTVNVNAGTVFTRLANDWTCVAEVRRMAGEVDDDDVDVRVEEDLESRVRIQSSFPENLLTKT